MTVKPKRITYHPACLLFPKLGKDELEELAEDIRIHGQRNDIVLYQGKVLDGRNRLAACEIAGVEPRFVEWSGNGSPVEWVISENLVRRHLSASQRAVIAHDLLPMLQQEAKARQRLSRGRGKKGAKKCATPPQAGKASAVAARIAKTNATYVETVKSINKTAPELVERVRCGDISIPDAKRLAEMPKRERTKLLKMANGKSHNGDIWRNLKIERSPKPLKAVPRTAAERKARTDKTTLICGDCGLAMEKLQASSVHAIISDPIYPEVQRDYGKINEAEWHDLMRKVVNESRRILKPRGSAVFIFQPNYEKVGKMRLWLWEFMAWAGREWNLVQDAYWWATDAMPLAGTNRKQGLMRQSVKMCVWLGSPDCYRNQDAVLWTPSQAAMTKHRTDVALRIGPNGRTYRNSTIMQSIDERGGTTPFNVLPIPTGGRPGGAEDHPAATPYDVAAWWCRYILPPRGVLLDPFVGSGTMLSAGLDHGASKVIGIDRARKYLQIAKRRIRNG